MYAIELAQKDNLFGGWTLCPDSFIELDYRLYCLQPKVIVECGSGISTLILSKYAKNTGAKVYCYEHQPFYYERTKKLLGPTGLQHVNLILCELSKDTYPIYNHELPKDIDFVLLDGPPLSTGGRRNIFPWIYLNLANNWEVWLDDGNRSDEQKAIQSWEEKFDFYCTETKINKGLVILSSQEPFKEKYEDLSDAFVSILSGLRPHLLEETLKNLPSFVINNLKGLCNGGDKETIKVYKDYGVDYFTTSEVLTIGQSFSLLAEKAKESGKKYWLSMEDDWKFITLDNLWLKKAKECLEKANQVRFRHYSDKTLPIHQVTKNPLNWKQDKYGLIENAHWTNNPFLMKCSDIDFVYPMNHEKHGQTNALRTKKDLIYQLYPGCFVHIGNNQSLKIKLGRSY